MKTSTIIVALICTANVLLGFSEEYKPVRNPLVAGEYTLIIEPNKTEQFESIAFSYPSEIRKMNDGDFTFFYEDDFGSIKTAEVNLTDDGFLLLLKEEIKFTRDGKESNHLRLVIYTGSLASYEQGNTIKHVGRYIEILTPQMSDGVWYEPLKREGRFVLQRKK